MDLADVAQQRAKDESAYRARMGDDERNVMLGDARGSLSSAYS